MKNLNTSDSILFVEPSFPIPAKSKNHRNFLPIGLLKLHEYYKHSGNEVKLVRGENSSEEIGTSFQPDVVMITSLFTYWSEYVRNSVKFYRHQYPSARMIVGGIYASLMPEHCKEYTRCDEVFIGCHPEAESYATERKLDYEVLSNPHPLDYQILHTSRGCPRKCKFCGTWKIEPSPSFKRTISGEISKSKLIFYDNNLLMNPFIEEILNELIDLKKSKKILNCESQSGFDGRVLISKPHLASMLKKAGFVYPRIAWDGPFEDCREIEKQITTLIDTGFRSKDIYVFMLFNWEIPFQEMEKKRRVCWKWKVQISDCRYRPLDQTHDNYNPRKKEQNREAYYIHDRWTDSEVRQFRRHIRRQNICVRQDVTFYSRSLERMRVSKLETQAAKGLSTEEASKILSDVWDPKS